MNAPSIDIPRLIRLAAVLVALATGCLVTLAYEPAIDAARTRLNDAEARLLSDDVAFESTNRLRAERATLALRYDTPSQKNPEAMFLRDLASTVTRRGVELVSTSVAQDAAPEASDAHPELFKHTAVSLELHGSYARLLDAIRDLSNGSAIVSVAAPTIRRDNGTLLASIPVTIYEPSATP